MPDPKDDATTRPRTHDTEGMRPARLETAREESDPRRPVIAEGRPDLSAEDPDSRAPQRGKDIPHDADRHDDAEGAGGRGQPDHGVAENASWQPGGSQPQPGERRKDIPMSQSPEGPVGTLVDEEQHTDGGR